MKCYKIDQFFHGYIRCPVAFARSRACNRAKGLGARRRRRSSRACKIARATRNGRAVRIVKSSFHNYSYELRFSYASTKNSCSEPLELSPPILDSSMSAPAKKKRKGKRNAEKRDIYVYILRSLECRISEPKGTIAPPPPISFAPPRRIPARDI